MKDHKVVWWILSGLLIASLVGIAIAGARMVGYTPHRASGPSAGLVGHAAPPFSLPLVRGEGASAGDRIALDALQGRVVLLDFWASWCNPCRQSIPALNEVHARYGERATMYGINVDRGLTRAGIEAAHRMFAAQFPSLADTTGQTQHDYQVQSIPTLVLIDREGVVRWTYTGVPDPDEVGERIDELLR